MRESHARCKSSQHFGLLGLFYVNFIFAVCTLQPLLDMTYDIEIVVNLLRP